MKLTEQKRAYIMATRKPGAGLRMIRMIEDEFPKGEKVLSVRLDFGTYDDLLRGAKEAGITVSEFVRRGIELALMTHDEL